MKGIINRRIIKDSLNSFSAVNPIREETLLRNPAAYCKMEAESKAGEVPGWKRIR